MNSGAEKNREVQPHFVLSKNKPQLHLELAELGGSQEVRIIDHNNTTLKSFKVAPGDGLIRKRTIMQIKTIIVPPTPHDSSGMGDRR